LYEVLPTEGIEGRRDYSDYRSSDPVMPYNCAAGPLRVASAPEPDPYIGELSRRAAANYTIDGWSSGVGLYRVLSKHQDAWSYVAGMKDQCHDAYPDGSPKSPRYKLVEEGTEGDVHKVYLRSWDGGLPDSYVSLTYSNGYLLMAGFGPTDRKDALKAFAAERKRIGETIDRYLVTTFSR
jgi:hypothetical protein